MEEFESRLPPVGLKTKTHGVGSQVHDLFFFFGGGGRGVG